MASTCYRPIADSRTYKSIVELGFQFPKPPNPSDASVFGCAARFNISAMETPTLSTDLRSADLPEDGEIPDSDDDDLPSLGKILASPKYVIDLTSDDDDDGESDDELPSVKRILASASPSSKQNPILHSQKQAANLTHENGDESGGDDGNLPETITGSSINSVLLPPPSLPKSPVYAIDDVTTPSATPGRKKHPWVNVPSWSPLRRRLQQYPDLPYIGTGSPGSPLSEPGPLPEDSRASVTERPVSPPEIPETTAVALKNIRHEEDGHGGDGEEHGIDQTQTITGASTVAGDGDLDVDEGNSAVRGENGPVMVDISTFTVVNILGKRSSPSGVEYECELGPPWLAAEMVEGLQMGRVHILSYEKGLIRDARVDTLRPKKRKLSPTEAC